MSAGVKWKDCKVTWWLYFYGKPLTSVRAHIAATPKDVRSAAMQQHLTLPLMEPGVAPFEKAAMIAMSEVRQ